MSPETVTVEPGPGRLQPGPEALAAIVAALEVHVAAERARTSRANTGVRFPWRFSGRSWGVVAASRSDRPLRSRW